MFHLTGEPVRMTVARAQDGGGRLADPEPSCGFEFPDWEAYRIPRNRSNFADPTRIIALMEATRPCQWGAMKPGRVLSTAASTAAGGTTPVIKALWICLMLTDLPDAHREASRCFAR